MMKNTFTMTTWDEAPYLELSDEVKYTRAQVSKTYDGQLVGNGQLEYILAYHAKSAATFVGIEHFNGSVDGKKGSVTISHSGTFKDGIVTSEFCIISASTTQDLIGLTGNGRFTSGHSMAVEFVIELSFS